MALTQIQMSISCLTLIWKGKESSWIISFMFRYSMQPFCSSKIQEIGHGCESSQKMKHPRAFGSWISQLYSGVMLASLKFSFASFPFISWKAETRQSLETATCNPYINTLLAFFPCSLLWQQLTLSKVLCCFILSMHFSELWFPWKEKELFKDFPSCREVCAVMACQHREAIIGH